MAGLLSYIAAGATQGVGEGIVASGAARRQAALAQYTQEREDARFQAGQNDVSTTFTDDQGNVNTIARGGLVRNTGVKAAVKTTADNKLVQVYDPKTKTITYKPETEASGMQAPPKVQAQPLPDRTLVPVWDPQKKANVWKPRSEAVGMEPAHTASQTNNEGGLTEADNRLWEIVTKKHTTKDPDTGDTTTDWAAVQKDLSARGRKDLADLAGDPPAAEVPPPEGNPASKEDNTGFGDGTDPETNPALPKPLPRTKDGNVDMTMLVNGQSYEAKDGSTGTWNAKTKALENVKPPKITVPTDKPSAVVKPPKGGGTQADPYQASAQADIDWFKQSAPAGAVINVNGKLYTKDASSPKP